VLSVKRRASPRSSSPGRRKQPQNQPPQRSDSDTQSRSFPGAKQGRTGPNQRSQHFGRPELT
jgi:hypothetical protein